MQYGLHGGADSAGVHTVSAGDTVWSIAQRYNLSMQDIVFVNDLRPPYELAANQRLKLPPPAVYKARDGDTLYGVSRTFNVDMTQLARMNSLHAPYVVRSGDVLKLPSVRPVYRQEWSQARVMAAPAHKPVYERGNDRMASMPPQPVAKPQISKTASAQTPPRAGDKFAWPVSGPVISSYGPKKDGLHNDGINIRAPKNAPVRAAENGVVVYADNELKGYGNLVLVRHADRWMTAYAHMDRLLVTRGETVRKGQALGTVGATGSVKEPQVHFETRRGTEALNPEIYLSKQGS